MKGCFVFINPPGPAKVYRSMTCTYVSKANYIWQPQDFINLSAQVPPDFEIHFVDCSADGLSQADVCDSLRSLSPQVVVTSLSSILYDNDMLFLARLREYLPEARILALGDIFLEPVFWEKGLEYADGLILNSLDVDFRHYLKTGSSMSANLVMKSDFEQKNARHEQMSCRKTSPVKVAIGVPRHEIFLSRKYRFPFAKAFLYSTVTTQFGCIFQCGYCSQSKISVSYRESGEILEEVDRIRHLGVRDLFWGDFSFGFPRENVITLLEELVRSGASMRWACYANPSMIDREMLVLMKRSGCHTVIIGVEDDDDGMLGSKYGRILAKERLFDFCGECHRLGIRVCGDFIVGLNSDVDATSRMVDLACRLKLDYASFNIITVLFGSRMREEMVRQKKLDPYSVGFDTSGSFGSGLEHLISLRNKAVSDFYMRPSYILRRIAGVRGTEEFMIQAQEMIAMVRNVVLSKKGIGTGSAPGWTANGRTGEQWK